MSERRKKTHGPTAVQVATNVRRLRQGQGMSIDDLIRATGGALSRDAVKKVEAASNPDAVAVRRVDVDDLMILALALGVNPSALLLPNRRNFQHPAQITGRGEVDSATAWNWADGKQPLAPNPGEREQAEFIAKARPYTR